MKYGRIIFDTVIILLIIGIVIACILALGSLCTQVAKAGQNPNDIAFHIAASKGWWVPTLKKVEVRDTSDAPVDTIVMADSSIHSDTLYGVLYNALGGSIGVTTYPVLVLDSLGSALDTIYVTEDYDDVYDTNQWHITYSLTIKDPAGDSLFNLTAWEDTGNLVYGTFHIIVVRNVSGDSLFVLNAWQDTSDLIYGDFFTINVLDSAENVVYTYGANKDSPDVYIDNYWLGPTYQIAILDSVEKVMYYLTALDDSADAYIRNWWGKGVSPGKTGVPGSGDYCVVFGNLRGPEGTKLGNTKVKFRLLGEGPIFFGNALQSKRLFEVSSDDTGYFAIKLMPTNSFWSPKDTSFRYAVTCDEALLHMEEAMVDSAYDSLSFDSIFR